MGENLTTNQQEVINSEPIGLQYFKAIDMMVDGLKPTREEGYFNILICPKNPSLPSIEILRANATFENWVNKYDEIKIGYEGKMLELNAKCDKEGNYIEYPREISKWGLEFLKKTITLLNDAVNIDGSKININNNICFKSKEGIWVTQGDKEPQLVNPKKELPNSDLSEG